MFTAVTGSMVIASCIHSVPPKKKEKNCLKLHSCDEKLPESPTEFIFYESLTGHQIVMNASR